MEVLRVYLSVNKKQRKNQKSESNQSCDHHIASILHLQMEFEGTPCIVCFKHLGDVDFFKYLVSDNVNVGIAHLQDRKDTPDFIVLRHVEVCSSVHDHVMTKCTMTPVEFIKLLSFLYCDKLVMCFSRTPIVHVGFETTAEREPTGHLQYIVYNEHTECLCVCMHIYIHVSHFLTV